MKVLHVSHAFFPEGSGGVESYVRELLRRQRERGDEAELLTGSLSVRAVVEVDRFEDGGVPVWRVHRDDLFFDHYAKLWHPGVERAVRSLLERERPDLVHVHHWIRLTGNLVEVAADAGIPTVVTLHDVCASCPRCFRVHRDGTACARPLGVESCLSCVPRFGHETVHEVESSIRLFADQLRAELDAARAVIVADAATADLLQATAGVPRERCDVLPMFRSEVRPHDPVDGPGDGPLRIGHWGWLAPHKGVAELLRAFRSVADDAAAPPVELHLLGPFTTPAFESELRELAADLPVTFHGPFEPAHIDSIGLHAAAFPSRAFETWSFVLDEALERGLPVIVSDVGAPASRAADAAIRVPPGDVQALTVAMRRLRDDTGLRDRLTGAAHVSAMTPAEHIDALERLYAGAVDAGAPSSFVRVDALRRAELLQLQRESALSRVCPEHGPH